MSNENKTNITEDLSNKRDQSTIPSQNGAWYYPSPKQFYKATVQKGHNVDPKDMEMVVAIHNAVNEKAWQEILKYEKFHQSECDFPKLIRFVGKPGEITPKAKIRNIIGWEKPFDRHDWLVDRCGKQIRYVVDFYDGEPHPHYPVSIHIDARPALESMSSVLDRIKMYCIEKKLL